MEATQITKEVLRESNNQYARYQELVNDFNGISKCLKIEMLKQEEFEEALEKAVILARKFKDINSNIDNARYNLELYFMKKEGQKSGELIRTKKEQVHDKDFLDSIEEKILQGELLNEVLLMISFDNVTERKELRFHKRNVEMKIEKVGMEVRKALNSLYESSTSDFEKFVIYQILDYNQSSKELFIIYNKGMASLDSDTFIAGWEILQVFGTYVREVIEQLKKVEYTIDKYSTAEKMVNIAFEEKAKEIISKIKI